MRLNECTKQKQQVVYCNKPSNQMLKPRDIGCPKAKFFLKKCHQISQLFSNLFGKEKKRWKNMKLFFGQEKT